MNDNIINKLIFGKKIKAKRERLNLTQYALADTIGVSQNFLGDIERGKKLPSLETLIKLSNTLKISLDSLFAESLDNFVSEKEDIYYSNKQLNIINNIIKTIEDNF